MARKLISQEQISQTQTPDVASNLLGVVAGLAFVGFIFALIACASVNSGPTTETTASNTALYLGAAESCFLTFAMALAATEVLRHLRRIAEAAEKLVDLSRQKGG
jgi:hypothetical protein